MKRRACEDFRRLSSCPIQTPWEDHSAAFAVSLRGAEAENQRLVAAGDARLARRGLAGTPICMDASPLLAASCRSVKNDSEWYNRAAGADYANATLERIRTGLI